MSTSHPFVVVGGGVAGLVAAATLAEHGPVVLFEGGALGGRARTTHVRGASLNFGPHALYRRGAARQALTALGLSLAGAPPPTAALGLGADTLAPLPFTPFHAATTSLLTPLERVAMARFVAGLPLSRPSAVAGRSVGDWLGQLPSAVARVAGALVRVSTYCADFATLDAGAALAQLQRALHGVDYLDGGWQQLVDVLVDLCRTRGVDLRAHTPVRAVRGTEVRTKAGRVDALGVVLCVGPRRAAILTEHPRLQRAAERAAPVRAACLDVVLQGAVDPRRRFALGLDRPLYISEHSSVARLAPTGFTVIHAAVYGGEDREGGTDAALLRDELEAGMDRLYDGWRHKVVHARFLPAMTVSHDAPRVDGERVSCAIAPGLRVAGDWVDSPFMLLDAAVDTALRACRELVEARDAA